MHDLSFLSWQITETEPNQKPGIFTNRNRNRNRGFLQDLNRNRTVTEVFDFEKTVTEP